MDGTLPEVLVQKADQQQIEFGGVCLVGRHQVGIDVKSQDWFEDDLVDSEAFYIIQACVDGHVEIV